MSTLTIDEAFEKLKPLLNENKLSIFVGAGISNGPPSNLPLWKDLIPLFVKFFEQLEQYVNDNEKGTFHNIIKEYNTSKPQDSIQVVSVIKKEIEHIINSNGNGVPIKKIFNKWTRATFGNKPPNQNHKQIVSTDYQYIITSNYDILLEDAAEELNFNDLSNNSYSFLDGANLATAIYNKKSSIIHIHGTLDDASIDHLVLTSKDYTKIKSDYPGFTLALLSIFLQQSVLLVGYGGNDPHLEDIFFTLAKDLKWDNKSFPRFYCVLKDVPTSLMKYKEQINTDIICIKDHSETTVLLDKLQKHKPRK